MLFIASLISWNHIHPVLVHFSTALVPASLVSDAFGKYLGRNSLTVAASWMMLYGAIATPFTVVAGWLWAAGIPAAAAEHLPGLVLHKWLGLSLAIIFGVMATWRSETSLGAGMPGLPYLILGAFVMAALMFQGFLGGQMTIG
jgi:uncharacterized membrane protein